MTFSQARRGYDPSEVQTFTAQVAEALDAAREELERLDADLASSRTTEEALRTTIADLTEEHDRLLDEARSEAETIRLGAGRDASLMAVRADDEAATIVMNARREALEIIAGARADADELLDAAHVAATPLVARLEQLRAVVRRTENLMKGLASGALGELAQAHLMLEEAPQPEGPGMQIVADDSLDEYRTEGSGSVSPLPAAVDRLLTHLREIG